MEMMDAVLDETPVDEVEQGEQPEQGQEQQQTEQTGQEQQETPDSKVDGRKFNPEWSKALKTLREQHPEHADMLTKLRDETARQLAFRELAPGGLDDFRNLKTTVEALGGAEAAAELMQRAASFDQIDQKLLASDVTVLDDLPEDMQKGFYGMLPDALSRLASTDEQAFNALTAPHFQRALASTGMGEHLEAMFKAADGNPQLQDMIRQQYAWYQSQTKGVASLPQSGKPSSPQQSRAERELAEIRKQQDEGFVKSVADGAVQYQSEAFDKSVAPYIKQLNLSDAQKDDLLDSFKAKVANQLGQDKAFQKQLEAYKSMRNRDPKTVSDFIRANIDKVAKPTLDGLITARYGKTANRTVRTAPTQTTTSGGAVRVNQAPPQSDWDMPKMLAAGYEQTAERGIYYLKGGRQVTTK